MLVIQIVVRMMMLRYGGREEFDVSASEKFILLNFLRLPLMFAGGLPWKFLHNSQLWARYIWIRPRRDRSLQPLNTMLTSYLVQNMIPDWMKSRPHQKFDPNKKYTWREWLCMGILEHKGTTFLFFLGFCWGLLYFVESIMNESAGESISNTLDDMGMPYIFLFLWNCPVCTRKKRSFFESFWTVSQKSKHLGVSFQNFRGSNALHLLFYVTAENLSCFAGANSIKCLSIFLTLCSNFRANNFCFHLSCANKCKFQPISCSLVSLFPIFLKKLNWISFKNSNLQCTTLDSFWLSYFHHFNTLL